MRQPVLPRAFHHHPTMREIPRHRSSITGAPGASYGHRRGCLGGLASVATGEGRAGILDIKTGIPDIKKWTFILLLSVVTS